MRRSRNTQGSEQFLPFDFMPRTKFHDQKNATAAKVIAPNQNPIQYQWEIDEEIRRAMLKVVPFAVNPAKQDPSLQTTWPTSAPKYLRRYDITSPSGRRMVAEAKRASIKATVFLAHSSADDEHVERVVLCTNARPVCTIH
jgi:hypothetical protein